MGGHTHTPIQHIPLTLTLTFFLVKGLICCTMKIMPLFTHPHNVSNLYDFIYSVKQQEEHIKDKVKFFKLQKWFKSTIKTPVLWSWMR